MSTVRAMNEAVNETEETVTQWVLQMAERGMLPANTARIRATALHQLVSVLDSSEPRDPAWLLEQIDAIGRRWSVKFTANPDTVGTYMGRARTLLTDYLRWKADPGPKFKFKIRVGETKGQSKKEKIAADSAPNPAATVSVPAASMRSFPLADSEFRFVVPPGFTMNDARKVAFHIATLTTDFDPYAPPSSYGLVSSK